MAENDIHYQTDRVRCQLKGMWCQFIENPGNCGEKRDNGHPCLLAERELKQDAEKEARPGDYVVIKAISLSILSSEIYPLNRIYVRRVVKIKSGKKEIVTNPFKLLPLLFK